MGIVNCTPDSFARSSRTFTIESGISRAMQLIAEGADIIDVGGESTRPGAKEVPLQQELDRVIPVIEILRRYTQIPISIDTRKSVVASEALLAGADIVNDISALRYDSRMPDVVTGTSAPVILMHMQGTPETMQKNPVYENVVEEVIAFFQERETFCLAHGIYQIVFDPGIGFGKRIEDNLALLRSLPRICGLGRPILIGTSRKSFIGVLTGQRVEERLAGSIASNVLAFSQGAHILRVHDVKPMRDALRIAEAIISNADGKI
jgi:dihydropteroate synthase